MKVCHVVLLSLFSLLLPARSADQRSPSEVALSFLPPGTQFAKLERTDSKTGKVIESRPAVLSGHLLSSTSNEIAFAYTNVSPGGEMKSLFVSVLHRLSDGYELVFEISYYGRYLWGQDFETMGLKTISFPGDRKECLAITTAVGASLGAQVEIYCWSDGLGMVNVMPGNGSVHRVAFLHDKDEFAVQLTFQRYPGEKGVPPPAVYRWDGTKMIPSSK